MTASICARSTSDTRCGVLIARDTVIALVPMRAAISASVTLPERVGRGLRDEVDEDMSEGCTGNPCAMQYRLAENASRPRLFTSVVMIKMTFLCCGAASKTLYKACQMIKIHDMLALTLLRCRCNISASDKKSRRALLKQQ